MTDLSSQPKVEWDDWRGGLATFSGPGGFTQVSMSFRAAESIAIALGVSFVPTNEPVKRDAEHAV